MKTLGSRPPKEYFYKNNSINVKTSIQALLPLMLKSIACLLGNEEIDESRETGSNAEKKYTKASKRLRIYQ